MLVLIVCTEGQNSEPAFIRQLGRCVLGQIHPNIEIIEVPLGGNHGHTDRVFEEADRRIEYLKSDEDSILSLVFDDNEAVIEKTLICDYDKMQKHGITEEDFRSNAIAHNYRLILNKPNFEFFVLSFITSPEYAITIKPREYEQEINKTIDVLNLKDRNEKGFVDTMKIPYYSKRQYQIELCFGRLLEYHPELLTEFCRKKPDLDAKCYSQMGELLAEIRDSVDAV